MIVCKKGFCLRKKKEGFGHSPSSPIFNRELKVCVIKKKKKQGLGAANQIGPRRRRVPRRKSVPRQTQSRTKKTTGSHSLLPRTTFPNHHLLASHHSLNITGFALFFYCLSRIFWSPIQPPSRSGAPLSFSPKPHPTPPKKKKKKTPLLRASIEDSPALHYCICNRINNINNIPVINNNTIVY